MTRSRAAGNRGRELPGLLACGSGCWWVCGVASQDSVQLLTHWDHMLAKWLFLTASLVSPILPRGYEKNGAVTHRVFISDLEVLRSFQNQIAAIQRDAVWWLHTVVPSISKLAPKDYVHW